MIHIFRSIDELASSLAAKVISLVRAAAQADQNFHIALSGGSTPQALFEKMASDTKMAIWIEKVKFFWVDERCVPPGHPESNYRMTDEILFKHFSFSYANVYRMMGEEDPHAEAARYEALLRTQVPIRKGLPCFDLVLLGMGSDGHIASIFPDQMYLFHSERICAVARHPGTGQQRTTLTGPVINNADKVYFMITGDTKATILGSILGDGIDRERYPAAYIKPVKGELAWYLDREAARLLHR